MLRVILCFLLILSFFIGCRQKPESSQQEEEFSSPELILPQIPKLAGPFKPANKEIQIALRNAGFYKGKIDGDIRTLSRKAIQEFQAENNLAVDGRVGPKTWSVLKKYLK